MNTSDPEVRELLRRSGFKARKPMARTPFGEKHREMVRTEEEFYPTIERLFGLHNLDFFHPTTNHLTRKRKGQKGWVDYVVLGFGWHAFLEVKAVSRATGRKGKLDPEQERYKSAIEVAAGEYRTFLLPPQWDELEDWLVEHTGKAIRGTWR